MRREATRQRNCEQKWGSPLEVAGRSHVDSVTALRAADVAENECLSVVLEVKRRLSIMV